MSKYDIAIIGGGIIGLATAYEVRKKYPHKTICIIEKENAPGLHQSSRNSGVIHSGIYYKPGSLKAQNCIGGKKMLTDFCDEHGIPYRVCGKVIVASYANELPNLEILLGRGKGHGIECRMLNGQELKEVEPYLTGLKGIHIPSVAVIKFSNVVEKLFELNKQQGVEFFLNSAVRKVREDEKGFIIKTNANPLEAKFIVNTAGLFADRIAEMCLGHSPIRIIPFRGEYYELKENARKYCNALIYPVPNPEYPFLGVHVTKMFDGKVECGPNAVLALSREGYSWDKLSIRDSIQTLTHRGFLKFGFKNIKTGIYEVYRSLSKQAFLHSIRALVPAISIEDIMPGASGVRAQAISHEGKLVDDFYFQEGKNQLHVLNAPSPAATSSLSIGRSILERIEKILPFN